MQVQHVPIDSVSPDPANARKHDKRSIDAIVGSLRAYGQIKPIVVSPDGTVLAGNGTLAAAKRLGWKQVAVVATDLPREKWAGYAIADNRVADLSRFDDQILAGLLSDPDIGYTGFDDRDLQRLLAPPEEKPTKPKPIKLSADQHAKVAEAIARVRERENDPELTDGWCLEMVAADFLAGA